MERIRALADMVPKGAILADIGCDHALVPIYLAQKGLIRGAIASDVNRGPLEKAKANINAHNLSPIISTRLSDGLKSFLPGEADCILIAGMGGELIIRILSESKSLILDSKTLILSPHTGVDQVREYMSEIAGIEEERLVKEEGKYYFIIKYNLSLPPEKLSKEEKLYGPLLLKRKDPLLKEYLEKLKSQYRDIIQELQSQNPDSVASRINELNGMTEVLDNCLERMGNG